jgi:hypothetical protein
VYELWQAKTLPDYFILQGNGNVDGLPAAAVGNALREVVAPQYLRDQTLSVIDQSFDILAGRADSPAIFVNLAPIKTTLRGPAAAKFAGTLAAGLPVCAAGEEALASGASIVKCRMPGGSTEQTAALIAAGLPAYLDRLPDQVNIVGEDTDVTYRVLRFSWLGAGRLGLSLTVLLLALITGTFWLLAAVIGANSAGGRLQWLGWMLLPSAVLVFLMGPSMYAGVWKEWLRYSLFPGNAPYAEFFRLAMQTSVATALRTVANAFMITGAVAGIAGLIAIGTGAMRSQQRITRGAIRIEPAAPKPQ